MQEEAVGQLLGAGAVGRKAAFYLVFHELGEGIICMKQLVAQSMHEDFRWHLTVELTGRRLFAHAPKLSRVE